MPCYNGAKLISRCFDSVLKQTYKNIELIVVNDGSTDNSEEVILSYRKRFHNEGMSLVYVYQENQGLGGAINGGLKELTGDYICWIDYDDFLYPESVEHRLNYLIKHPDIAVVTSDAYFLEPNKLESKSKKASDGKPDLYNPWQFENHLRSQAIFCSGCHMIRTEAFFDAVPSRQIYPARRGQNWQMLLPVYYKYKQAFIDEPLYAYILYDNSMSRTDVKKADYEKRYQDHLDIIIHTLDSIDMSDKERKRYLRIYKQTYYREYFYLGISFHDYSMIIKNIFNMLKVGALKAKDIQWMISLLLGKNKKTKDD